MIQRIQSIFLLLASLTLGLLFVQSFNIGITTNALSDNIILSDGDLDTYDFTLLTGLTGFAVLIFVAAIFMFKNRVLQGSVTKLGLGLVILLLGASIYYFIETKTIAETANASLEPSFGWASPVLAIIFCILALRGISKDDKLVKSMDRLR